MSRREDAGTARVVGQLAGRVILTAVMILVIFVAARFAYSFGRDVFYQPPSEASPGRDITVELPGADGCSKVLFDAGLISNEKAFGIMEKVYRLDAAKGIYQLNTSQTSKELIFSISGQSTAIREYEAEHQTESAEENVLGAGDEEG